LRKPEILVLGNYQQTIAVVRSLSRAGYSVLVGRSGRRSFTELSRHASGAWVHPDPRDRRAFLDALNGLLGARPEIRYVFPVGDVDLDLAAERYEKLSRRCGLAMVEPEVLRVCIDKTSMYGIAARAGVPVPGGGLVEEFGALKQKAGEIGFPVLLKRPNSFSLVEGRKALICRDWEAVEAARPALRSGPVLIQKWIRGPRYNCQIAALRGEVFAYFENRNLRTDRADRTGYGVEWISVPPTPELRSHCEALAREIAYSGVGLIQFLVEDGRPFFLELNPRLGMPWELSRRCGIDFAMLALRCADAVRDPAQGIPRAAARYAVGIRCYWPLGDLVALATYEHRPSARVSRVLAMIASLCCAHFMLTWSWRDPLPTLFLYARFAASRLSRWRRSLGALRRMGTSS
jgi:predicted ATP-grasp superfamily ATP-dependent carboligase